MFLPALERLRGTPARLEDRLRGVSRAVLTAKSDPSVWSIQENVGHLLSLEPLWAERLGQFQAGAEELVAWEETNSSTWSAAYNAQNLASILNRFRESRQRLVADFEGLPDQVLERTALHPRLKKPMRTLDLVYFVAEHDDYHLAQITRLLKMHK
jgi:uncharacterized damage-inducible protein DinB